MKDKKDSIAQQLGRRGGQKVLKKYGKSHYQKMVQKRWDKYYAEKEKLAEQNETPSGN